jgi:phage terminase large subunit-like protein
MRLALRVKGETPPRAVFTTTPPREIDWLLELCAERSTRVIRGEMKDNPTLDERAVTSAYESMDGTVEGERELKGKVVIGVDGALFDAEVLERDRVDEAPPLDAVVVAVDPAQSARKTADTVGLVAVGYARGHLYVLESYSEHMTPEEWSSRALTMADDHDAGKYVVEPTGGGENPKALLNQAMRLVEGAPRLPIVESKARQSKADRAGPLSGASSRGRLHLVGRNHAALEREATTWYPGASFSPGAMDALVHGASVLTNNWRALE